MNVLPLELVPLTSLRLTDRPRYTQARFRGLVARFTRARQRNEGWPQEMPPLLVAREPSGRLTLLDGHHRSMAALTDGWDRGPARMISRREFDRHVARLGSPVEAIQQLTVAGPPPPEEWEPLFERLRRGRARRVEIPPEARPEHDSALAEEFRRVPETMTDLLSRIGKEGGLQFTATSARKVVQQLRTMILGAAAATVAERRAGEVLDAALAEGTGEYPLTALARGSIVGSAIRDLPLPGGVSRWASIWLRLPSAAGEWRAIRLRMLEMPETGRQLARPAVPLAGTIPYRSRQDMAASETAWAREALEREGHIRPEVSPEAVITDYATRVVRQVLALVLTAIGERARPDFIRRLWRYMVVVHFDGHRR